MLRDSIERAKSFLSGRRLAYLQVFKKDDKFAEEVLADLATFCRANRSTFLPNERAHALLEGRREVWLRIQEHLKLSDDDLWKLINGRRGLPNE